jgi:hypothetical protein
VTTRTARHRLFQYCPAEVITESKIVVVTSDNPFILGALSSRIHSLFSQVAGGWLGVGNDSTYNHLDCFCKYPFPELDSQHAEVISNLVERIDSLRKRQQEHYPNLTLTKTYNVLEKLRRDEILTKTEQDTNQQGLVSSLRELHDELDRTVFTAYGWDDLGDILVGMPGATTPLPDKSDMQAEAEEALLMRLVELNHRRAEEEAQGLIRWLRPDYQSPEAQQVDIELSKDAELVIPEKKVAPKKVTWPKELRDQIKALVGLLSMPVTAQALSENFKRNPINRVNAVLDALEALGKAQKENELWYLT